MGFGTILGMHNLRAFLRKFAVEAATRKNIKVETVEYRANSRLAAHGFEPGLSELTIFKNDEVLYLIDASDDDGYFSEGKKDHEAYTRFNKAIDQMQMEEALAALDELSR